MAALRADAQQNLGRVLQAAAEAFAEYGPDVSVDEIARRAGVGHGTVFRRFPTKDALIAAVIGTRLGELGDRAESLLDEPDPGAALERFVWQIAELHARDRVLFEGVQRCSEMPEIADAKQRLSELVERLVARAQDEGALRRDIRPEDVTGLVGSAMVGSTQAPGDDAWRRYIRIVLDGLRPPSAVP
jgi:AcrR family transcriptional regulator